MKKRFREKTPPVKNRPANLTDRLKDARQKLEKAENFRLQRSFDSAEKICVGLLKEYPDYYAAAHTLGLALSDKGDHKNAVRYLNRAAILLPQGWETRASLAGEYLELRSTDLALKTAKEALALSPKTAVIYQLLGEIHMQRRAIALARDSFAKAKDLDPSMMEACRGFVRACLELGEYSAAAKALDTLLAKYPENLNLMNHYFDLPAAFAKQNTKQKISQQILGRSKLQNETAKSRAFSRIKAHEANGEIEQAWSSAKKANKLIYTTHAKEAQIERDEINSRVEWLLKNANTLKAPLEPDENLPVSLFIFGPSRSGKTTLEGLLGHHPEVLKGYESPVIQNVIQAAYHESGHFPVKSIAPLPHQFYKNVTKLYAENLPVEARSHKIFTNTTPGYIWDAPFFRSVFPNARFVFIKRNIDDLMWRIFAKSYRNGNFYSYELANLKQYITRYYQVVDLMADQMPEIVKVVSYEDIITRPAEICSEVLEGYGLSSGLDIGVEVRGDIGCAQPLKKFMATELAQDG